MKLVPEYINEKFSEDSDPITDMGIGIIIKLQNFLKNKQSNLVFGEDNTKILCYAAFENEYLIVKYLLSIGTPIRMLGDPYKIGSWDALTFAALKKNLEIANLLIENGANLEETIKYANEYCNSQVENGLKWIKIRLSNRDQKVNEKFSEDSDPINDMGIGLEAYLRKTLPQEVKEEGPKSCIETSWRYYNSSKYGEEAFTVFQVLKRMVNFDIYKQEDIQEIFDNVISSKSHKINLNIKKVIEALYKFYHIEVIYKKNKSVNEKFTEEESDPIKDMGIGIVTWENFQIGDVLSNMIYENHAWWVIYDTVITSYGDLKLKLIGFNRICKPLFNAIHDVKNKTGREIEDTWATTSVSHSLDFWKMKYKFVQLRDLKLEESVNEKFSEDGDPIHDMDIGPQGIIYRCGECGSLLDDNYNALSDGEEFERAKNILKIFGDDSKRVKYVWCNWCANEEQDRIAQEEYAREQAREQERQEEEEQRWREENDNDRRYY